MTDEIDTIVEESEPAVLTPATVTLVEGPTFCVSSASGDMAPGAPQGLFFRDMRVISDWRVRVDGIRPHHLTVLSHDPYRTTFLARVPPHGSQSELLVERTRYVGEGMREDLTVRNLSPRAATLAVSVDIGADFADLFAVKESRVSSQGEVTARPDGSVLEFDLHSDAAWRGVRVESEGARARPDGLDFRAEVPARGQWRTTVLVRPSVEQEHAGGVFPVGVEPAESAPARRLRAWRENTPHITKIEDPELHRTMRRSLEDLGALRIFDPAHPEDTAVAAGAPWFMALFGRDSLLPPTWLCPWTRTWHWGPCRRWPGLRAGRSTPPPRNSRDAYSTRRASAWTSRWPAAAAASTTGLPTPHRCSSSSSVS
ncbi:glycogen debranching N-terminal domain-containing protein [Streptomyces sp. CSMPJR101]|uniref:glycogen debranching N-terminal domain-containing protein n=1 Tax=Streptomyces sp. CSMPJR101 TaxID=1279378 RepID=UPI00385453D2